MGQLDWIQLVHSPTVPPQQLGVARGAVRVEHLGVAVQVAFESKALKPGNYSLIGSRFELKSGAFKPWVNWIQLAPPHLATGGNLRRCDHLQHAGVRVVVQPHARRRRLHVV
jgi:hypothetical protein